MIYVAGLTYEDVKFVSNWAGTAVDYRAAAAAALGHSSEEYWRHLETVFELSQRWQEAGGTFPIDERQKVFAPPSPKPAAKAVPGRVPSVGGHHVLQTA